MTSVCPSAGRDLKLVAHVASVPENIPLRDCRFTDRPYIPAYGTDSEPFTFQLIYDRALLSVHQAIGIPPTSPSFGKVAFRESARRNIYAPSARLYYEIHRIAVSMESSDSKPSASAPPPGTTSAQPQAVARPLSPPTSESASKTEPKVSTSQDAPRLSTPPFSPSSQTPILQNEQEEFEGNVDVNNDIPSQEDLQKVGDLLVLDAEGKSRPFKELHNAPHVAPRQLIIFIRHFFCGVSVTI